MKMTELIQNPDYWLRIRRRFKWHLEKSLEPRCGDRMHHVRCLVFLRPLLDKDWETFSLRCEGDVWGRP